MTEIERDKLIEARRAVGLYSIEELCTMYSCGRSQIDNWINTGELDYMSPNNRDRYINLSDFINVAKRSKGGDCQKSE